jgi:hypothetical protein
VWVLVFAAPAWFADSDFHPSLRAAFPNAQLCGCSTAGEISQAGVGSASCVITAVTWAGSPPAVAVTELASMEDSLAAGMRLGRKIPAAQTVLVFAPGVGVNGSALVDGLAASLPTATRIMGGLAGDDGAFRQTYTLTDAGISSRAVVAMALPAGLQVGHGSFGGWKPFGPAHKVTSSRTNILFELDGEPALTVYRRYLGQHAKDLPASGLLFPFEMLAADHAGTGLIRTILGIDEAAGSLILAGDIDPRGYLRLMHASTDALVQGAQTAAEAAVVSLAGKPDHALALLISCVGRKLVMGERVDEEIESVATILGDGTVLTGFYSYGEIGPDSGKNDCRLHNQTMTITCITEPDRLRRGSADEDMHR